MEARTLRAAFVAVLLVVSMGAKYRTANFIIETADPRLAQQFGEAAEAFRHTLAVSWLGKELPRWSQPCPIKVTVGPNLGAGGATTFTFDRGEVFGWTMSIQGSRERVLDSVLPHEITHMIFASHFRRPLPRWADEGGATSVEHASERNKQRAMLDQFLRTGRGIAFSSMFAMTEYPADVLPLYAQGYSTVEFLIQNGGRRRYIAFLEDGLKDNNWSAELKKHYGLKNLGDFQNTWLVWVKQGSPLKSPTATATPGMLAASHSRDNVPASPMPTPIAKTTTPGTSEIALANNGNYPKGNQDLLPARPLAPVSDKPGPAANALAAASMTSVHPNAPYTPGSTIAVSRLSIPSTGWRASYTTPLSNTLANATVAPKPADPYRAHVSHPQPLEGPKPTTLWR